jgi:hypothetical protein
MNEPVDAAAPRSDSRGRDGRRAVVARGLVVLLCAALGLLIAGNILAVVLPLMHRRVSPVAAWAIAVACSASAVVAGVLMTRSAAP